MLYSQINYLGSIIPLTNETHNAIEDLIVSFVKGPLNLAKKRVFQTVCMGGIGLFPIVDFIDAQKSTWIKRCMDLSEPWKVVIYIKKTMVIYSIVSREI